MAKRATKKTPARPARKRLAARTSGKTTAKKSTSTKRTPRKSTARKTTAKKTAKKTATRGSRSTPLDRVRKIALAFPEAHEVSAWSAPTFRVRNKLFAMYAEEGNHHHDGRPGIWIKATSANQSLMVASSPDRFFVPPYVGPSGWIGVFLDRAVDWDELRELLRDGYRMTAPPKLRDLA